jgi:hypothetical protein
MELGSNLAAKFAHRLRCLFAGHIKNESIRGSNLFGKLFDRVQDIRFRFQWYNLYKAFVGDK